MSEGLRMGGSREKIDEEGGVELGRKGCHPLKIETFLTFICLNSTSFLFHYVLTVFCNSTLLNRSYRGAVRYNGRIRV